MTDQYHQPPSRGGLVMDANMVVYGGAPFSPGHDSVFEQQLRRHLYKLAGRTTLAGRPALKLVPAHGSTALINGQYQLLGSVYVSPRTYTPIREVVNDGTGNSFVLEWTRYTVQPDTAANRRLLSLTARHPDARIVHGIGAFIAAQTQEAISARR